MAIYIRKDGEKYVINGKAVVDKKALEALLEGFKGFVIWTVS